MIEQGDMGTVVVVAMYAVAGVLAVIGGIVAMKARHRRRGH
ncbi:hypothetical protein [Thioalkalivibrio sp. XN279]|nr:hypothetical protein [Thioalkalivibrio sp. XN279]